MIPCSRLPFAIAMCLVGFAPASVAAQPAVVRVGAELQVNTYTLEPQERSAVGVDAAGNFVVVWMSEDEDGGAYGIFGRRFASTGVALGGAFQVNTVTLSYQNHPVVGVAADGDFVVAWQSYNQDGAGYGVFAQRFAADGAAQGAEFLVNTLIAYDQKRPAVGVDAEGDFVVVWQGVDAEFYGILGQRFNSSGSRIGAEFRANAVAAGSQILPAMAMNPAGEFVVAWVLQPDYDILARRFDAAGTPQGIDVSVSTAVDTRPVVGIDSSGRFVVAWESFLDGSVTGIFAKRFESSGSPSGATFQVNTYTTGNQEYPALAMNDDGFVVTWHSYQQDGDSFASLLRRFDAQGAPLTGEIQVSAFTTSAQRDPAVGMNTAGDFVVAWGSYHTLSPGAGDIFAQRFQALAVLDIDGNGATAPLSDGILVLRFLFGFEGDLLVAGAVDEDHCTRCDATTIGEYLQTLI